MKKKKDKIYTKKEMLKRLKEYKRRDDFGYGICIFVGVKIIKPGTDEFKKLMEDIEKNENSMQTCYSRCDDVRECMHICFIQNDPMKFRKFELEYFRLWKMGRNIDKRLWHLRAGMSYSEKKKWLKERTTEIEKSEQELEKKWESLPKYQNKPNDESERNSDTND